MIFPRSADKMIRAFLKRTLHLNIYTLSQNLHDKVRDVGLEIPELRREIPHIFIGRLNNFSSIEDTGAHALMSIHFLAQLRVQLISLAGEY